MPPVSPDGEPRILIPPTLSPAAFAARDSAGRIAQFAGETMGTRWSLSAVSAPVDTARTVQAALDRVVAQMSQWEPASDISRFNRSAPGTWQSLPPEFARVLKAALQVAESSGGAFDPALGAAVDLWGFGPAPAPDDAPAEAATTAAVAGGIDFDGPGLRARRTASARLDLSAIAKGFGADLAAEHLLASGLRHFLLEVGGELRGHGLKPEGQPWWVEIERPPQARFAPLRMALHEQAVATSGDYRRWLDAGGERHAHTLDPRTGRPVANAVHSVTVLHESCMMADAWATALTVLGATEGIALADAEGLAVYMIAGEEELLSAALRTMLD
ncbi:FAD:protein FMN transferase [Novosphingobium sp. JCM 18896]|uniref:FAD:protein FMN transferase n=1 Tax=Novosphingobium sp. JCM 18896 TaxID=2989731 RepID=UPI0022219AB5|nr:FAD:protein FMN transferase [Novosphingobium sp. JCM 18896]MCW1429888.1 FAD:protein FMN transferase [Novosphingobium sp. JCM 18896]